MRRFRRLQSPWRAGALVAVVAATVLLVGGLPLPGGPLPNTKLSASYVASRPELNLRFPFSHLLYTESHGEGLYDPMAGRHPQGNAPASAAIFLQVPLPPTDAAASVLWWWYRQQLTLRGWHLVASDNKSAGNYEQVYGRGRRERLTIGFDGADPPGAVKYDGRGAVYSMYYEVASCTNPTSMC